MKKSEDKQKKLNKNNQNFWKYGAVLVLAVLVVGGFIFFSGGDNNSNLSGNVIATVNGEEITTSEVSAIQQSFIQQGQQISEEDALEQVINQKLISQEVEAGDYYVSTEEAESTIEQQLSMQGASLEDYKQQISQQGIVYEEQLDSIKEELAVQKYLETQLEGENFEVSKQEAKEFYEMYKQQSGINETYEELEPQIMATLQQQKQQETIGYLIQELRADAEIKYLKEVGSEEESLGDFPIEITE
jgi:parvulin-like peptidyl-prolyl isomerase